jgi:DNA-binding MarR family transcriptional regulator
MLPESQARILRLLARHPVEMEAAWDVPRELSLPGLAESLGLVRSALHEPLKALDEAGLIHSRTAHVIGGGTRKRNVVHLTVKGRHQASALVGGAGLKMDLPEREGLLGRSVELAEIITAMSSGSIVLTGMPGIGKTALLQAIPEARYVAMDAAMDARSLTAAWLEIEDAPIDLEAQIEMLAGHRLIADEVQDVHDRHVDGVHALLNGLPHVAIGIRAPSPFPGAMTLQGLDSESAAKLLGEGVDAEVAADVCEALDGHPLALHLWTPADELPEAGDAVQAFVEETVLSRLDTDERAVLDALSCEPRPVLADDVGDLDFEPLDAAALLRWPQGRLEVQHLIRNVRRVAWTVPEDLHAVAATRWSSVVGAEARWFEAHHLTMSGQDPSAFILEHEAEILTQSAAAAALLDDALHALPEAQALRRLAARLALDRGEPDHAATHLRALEEDDHILRARLHRTNGDLNAAEAAEAAAMAVATKSEAAHMHLSGLSGRLDDRLPDEVGDLAAVEKGLADVRIGNLEDAKKRAAIVLIAILRHRIAMLRDDGETAAAVRKDLADLAGGEDPLTERLAHIERLRMSDADSAARLEAEGAMRRLVSRTHAPIQRVALGLALVEAQARSNPPGAATTLEGLQAIPLPLDQAAGRRLDALRWFWQGRLDESQRIACWREAALRLRTAECPRAARTLTTRLHRSL